MKAGFLETSVTGAIDKRVLMLIVVLLISVFGVWSFLNLHVDAVPDISNIQVTVTTTARGLAPKEVEQYITYPVEIALQSLPHLSMQRSISKYGLSQITAVFEDGTDIYWARQQVSERLSNVQTQMPPNADVNLALGPIATGLGEIYQFEVRGFGYSPMQLRNILDWQIIPSLKSVAGVDEVQSMGGDAKEYQVLLDPERMHGYKIALTDVCNALSSNNSNSGGGYAVEQANQVLVRGEGMLSSVSDINNVVIRRSGEGVVRIKDVGNAVIGKKLAQSIVTHDGVGETIIGIVVMRKGENSKQLTDRIKERIEQIRHELPPNVSIVPFYDRSDLINRTIETVKDNLMHGALLVLIVLFVLLGSVRGGAIAALSIPLAMSGALIFLTLSGTSGNLLSLGAIDFGILIDGSVVVVENILRHLSHSANRGWRRDAAAPLAAGNAGPIAADRLTVIKDAAAEVASPVLFAVLIITVVYLPILGLPGVSGKTFQPMALTVVFGLLTALAIALYVTPSLCHFVLEKKPTERESLLLRLIRPAYRRTLYACTRRPLITFSVAFLVFAAAIASSPFLGTEFIPVLKEGAIVLTVNRPVSGSLQTAAEQTTLIERVLADIPQVERTLSRTGHSEIAFDPMGPDETDVFVILKPPSEWGPGVTQQDIENKVADELHETLPGLVYSMSQPIEQRMNELVAGVKGDIAVRIFGPDLDELRAIGADVSEILSGIPGSSDIKLDQTSGLPVMTAKLNHQALAAYGVQSQEALNTVAACIGGKTVGTIYEGKPRYSLVVRFRPDAVTRAEQIGDLPVAMTNGELVPLGQLAKLKRTDDAALISHLQSDRIYTVQVNVRGRDLGGFVEEAQKRVAAIKLPTGYHVEWGGQFENMRQAQQRLMILVPIALILIFALLYTLFGDLMPGVLIFSNIPMAVAGGIFGLLARGMHLSVTAGVGFIALFGVAVLNGVVLVSTIRSLEREHGMSPRQAAIAGAGQRFRPVLMTAMVASLGFVPMAMATSVGAEVQRPLATVVIFGLITSTLLTLLVLPSLYPIMCGKRSKRLSGSAKL